MLRGSDGNLLRFLRDSEQVSSPLNKSDHDMLIGSGTKSGIYVINVNNFM